MSAPPIPSEWKVGALVYLNVVDNGKPYAVLKGSTVQDKEHAFAVRWDSKSGNFYFTNLQTKTTAWELPPNLTPKSSGSQLASAAQPAPSNSRTTKERITAMYTAYCPSKLHQVDAILNQYQGREDECIAALVKKYGPEPPATTASATEATTPSYASRVTRFYEVYCPQKVGLVPKQLDKYKGQEELLIQALIDKYGVEPGPAVESTSSTSTAATTPPTTEGGATAPPESNPQSTKDVDSKMSSEGTGTVAQPPQGDNSDGHVAASPASPPAVRSAKVQLQNAIETVSNIAKGTPGTHPTSVALIEAENRERVLVGFVQDREQRLAEAHTRYESASHALEALRRTNRDLIAEMEALRRNADNEVHEARLQMDTLREDNQLSRNEWHRERQRLQAAVDDAAGNSGKQLQNERLKLEEQTVKFIGEKSQLQSDLHKAKQDYDDQMQRSSDLVAVLDKKDKEHQRLLHRIDELQCKIEGVSRATQETQTDPTDLLPSVTASQQPPTDSPNGQQHRDAAQHISFGMSSPNMQQRPQTAAAMSAIEEFDRVMATDKYRREELDGWRARCIQLEQALAQARDAAIMLPTAGSPHEDHQNAARQLKSLRATIGALRASNKVLDAKVGELELRLAAQPTVEVVASPGHGTHSEDASQLKDAVDMLRNKLEATQSIARNQKREIQELRGQLVGYMSSPSPLGYRR